MIIAFTNLNLPSAVERGVTDHGTNDHTGAATSTTVMNKKNPFLIRHEMGTTAIWSFARFELYQISFTESRDVKAFEPRNSVRKNENPCRVEMVCKRRPEVNTRGQTTVKGPSRFSRSVNAPSSAQNIRSSKPPDFKNASRVQNMNAPPQKPASFAGTRVASIRMRT